MKTRQARILVVDDEAAVRETLMDYLEDEGFELKGAGSGELALQWLALNESDVAVVDMRLPGMDGSQFIQRSKQLRPEMKHLIYTGSVEFSLSRKLHELGVEDEMLFHKPLRDMGVLVRAIRMLTCEQRQAG